VKENSIIEVVEAASEEVMQKTRIKVSEVGYSGIKKR
jgi:hypothetical protein